MPAQVRIATYQSADEPQKSPSVAHQLVGKDRVSHFSNFAMQATTDGTDDKSTQRNHHSSHMDDISMSPRLLGYTFSCISMAVCVISSTIFYSVSVEKANGAALQHYVKDMGVTMSAEQSELINERVDEMNETYEVYVGPGGNLIQKYKVYGSIVVSTLRGTVSLLQQCICTDLPPLPSRCRYLALSQLSH